MEKKQPENNLNKRVTRNYFFVCFFFLLLIFAVLYRIFVISFVEGNAWRDLRSKQKKADVVVPAARGNIFSCDNQLMATTEYRYRVNVDFWAESLNPDTLRAYIDELSVELNRLVPQRSASQHKSHILAGLNKKEAERKKWELNKKGPRTREYRLFSQDLDYLQYKELLQIPSFRKAITLMALNTSKKVRRIKPYGTLASRTIGDIYGNYEKGGSSGLEKYYDDLLKGEAGRSTRQRVNGRWVNVIDTEPVNGVDIISTIDITIQDITEKALSNKLKDLNAESGTAIVMEVKTGEVKAITNLGRVREGVWGEDKNYAVSDLSEPGSTFKVVSMMVALEDGVIKPDDIVETGNGVYFVGSSPIRDHNAHRGGYGTITADRSIRYSSNVGVAKIILQAYEKNPSKYVEGIYKIGIQKDLELEIPGYAVPNIRHPKDTVRYWSKTTLPWMSFGYETQVPPIYTLTFFNAIANNGKMMKPLFTKEIRREGSIIEKKKPVVVNEKICSKNTLALVQQMLDDVVNTEDGTGKPARSSKVRVAGKTGTAQLSQGSAGYKAGVPSHQVSFCGYFPADDPKYSCIVVIRRPQVGLPSGGNMCGTVLKQIAENLYARNILYKKLDLPVDTLHVHDPSVKCGWKDRPVKENLVPNVVGMGAKDAVYALERAGLRVNLSGKGTVRSQSIHPGANIVRGQTVAIQLR